jgi:hypothetical protein
MLKVSISVTLLLTFLISSVLFAEDRFAALKVDITSILSNGCIRIPAHKEGQGQCTEISAHLDCSQLGLEKNYGCSPVQEVPDYLGGLEPKVPIVECVFYGDWGKETKDGIRYIGAGMIPVYNKFIVFPNQAHKVLNNPSEFQAFFAPIDTAEEAFSYAAALTGSYPIYKIEMPKGYKMEASSIKASYVESTPEGFKVHLFNNKVGGCGPHHYYAVDYLVTKEGTLIEMGMQNIWRDPSEDDLCVD